MPSSEFKKIFVSYKLIVRGLFLIKTLQHLAASPLNRATLHVSENCFAGTK